VRYRAIVDVVSGAIFLGAPHLVSDLATSKKTFDLLSSCENNKGLGRSLSNQSDIAALIQICKAFELVNLNVPVVSAYEEKETSTQSYLFSRVRLRSRSQVVRLGAHILATPVRGKETLIRPCAADNSKGHGCFGSEYRNSRWM